MASLFSIVCINSFSGFGRVEYFHGSLRVEITSSLSLLTSIDSIEHASPAVALFDTTVMPFWRRESILVTDGEQRALAAPLRPPEQGLAEALASDGGFEVFDAAVPGPLKMQFAVWYFAARRGWNLPLRPRFAPPISQGSAPHS